MATESRTPAPECRYDAGTLLREALDRHPYLRTVIAEGAEAPREHLEAGRASLEWHGERYEIREDWERRCTNSRQARLLADELVTGLRDELGGRHRSRR